jgi:hypothetical protein
VFLVVWTMLRGLTLPTGVAVAVNGLVAWGIGKSVIELFGDQFRATDFIKTGHLRDCFQEREGVIERIRIQELSDAESNEAQSLMRSYLRFLERTLRESVGEYDYEFSVFLDAENPVIACYHDTGGRTLPASHDARAQNPRYYREQRYKVVELLDNPDGPLHFISNTRSRSAGYNFTSEQQRKDVGSTILCRLAGRRAAALVVACDQESAFSQDDIRLRQLTHAVSAALGADLDLCGRIQEAGQ